MEFRFRLVEPENPFLRLAAPFFGDFVIREGITIVQAIQVCHSFNTAQTKTREVSGLLEAMNVYGLEEGLILLQDTQEHTIEENGKVIRVMPVWKWLLK